MAVYRASCDGLADSGMEVASPTKLDTGRFGSAATSARYPSTSLATVLAGMSSHSQQRASAVELQAASKAARAYLTHKMEEMVETSREQSRKRGNSGGAGSSQQVNKPLKQDLTDD